MLVQDAPAICSQLAQSPHLSASLLERCQMIAGALAVAGSELEVLRAGARVNLRNVTDVKIPLSVDPSLASVVVQREGVVDTMTVKTDQVQLTQLVLFRCCVKSLFLNSLWLLQGLLEFREQLVPVVNAGLSVLNHMTTSWSSNVSEPPSMGDSRSNTSPQILSFFYSYVLIMMAS